MHIAENINDLSEDHHLSPQVQNYRGPETEKQIIRSTSYVVLNVHVNVDYKQNSIEFKITESKQICHHAVYLHLNSCEDKRSQLG